MFSSYRYGFSLGNCILDFNTFPYEPTGICTSEDDDRLYLWDAIYTTRCCRNALTAAAKALALNINATATPTTLFLPQPQWANCTGPFSRQPSVSLQGCGLQNMFAGGSHFSTLLYLPTLLQSKVYEAAVRNCSGFDGGGFDGVCSGCVTAVAAVRGAVMDEFGIRREDKNENAAIGFSAVVAVAAGRIGNSTDFDAIFQCLSASDTLISGYFKIKDSVAKALVSAIVGVLVLLLIVLLVKHATKKNKKTKPCASNDTSIWSGLYRFTKDEINKALDFGNERTSLGRGSAGQVYKGMLPSGQLVAIKKIFQSNTSDSFIREVDGLSRVRHPNLVCLLGCCIENGEQYLVYEYCEQGNLAQHLMRKDTLLSWETRVKILRQCALALRYLHQRADGCIVHRDIKLTNILLTEKLDGKLSDFGLARMLGMDETKVFTDVRGTIGYMDPEYMSNAKLTCASDIYSFGIVALQLLSGQKVIDLDLDARDQLTRKAKDVNMGLRPLSDFEDPRLKEDVNKADFESILQVAVLCVAKSSKGRPTIDIVFEEMDKVWHNTHANKVAKQQMTSPATSLSKPWEAVPV
ncbi:probable leucine-rich repeat receptor-like protein kinase At5g49770 [Cucurbita moschata]|uniref:Probable leucine-rich repeat receptor-like protein kinase At5g49770 n=1 Tax=Cucurbita moschata TaxID=3662 RepID=A0A6J1EIA4_CUCMO|nr:probable leucine-rich repeat receptor-like protein kinase At5g49770 [Cucurbita moschata]